MGRRSSRLLVPIRGGGRGLTTDRRAPSALLLLLLLFTEIRGKRISSPREVALDFANNRSAERNSSFMLQDKNDEGDIFLAYSGYLRSKSSMIDLQTRNPNFTNDYALVAHSNSTNKRPKVNGHRRVKRGVTHLYNMILCATGCNPLAYKGYGCYCGFLGSGYPMDGIDRCCKMHDWCYDATNCPMFVEYFVPYYWKCYQGYKPICAIEHGEWGSSGSCAQRLCECDRSFAECLRRYRCPRHKAVCTSSPWRLIQNIFMII